MYFTDTPELRKFERQMQGVSNFDRYNPYDDEETTSEEKERPELNDRHMSE